jgi:hypothetical protein
MRRRERCWLQGASQKRDLPSDDILDVVFNSEQRLDFRTDSDRPPAARRTATAVPREPAPCRTLSMALLVRSTSSALPVAALTRAVVVAPDPTPPRAPPAKCIKPQCPQQCPQSIPHQRWIAVQSSVASTTAQLVRRWVRAISLQTTNQRSVLSMAVQSQSHFLHW